jgi:hypothetical protein
MDTAVIVKRINRTSRVMTKEQKDIWNSNRSSRPRLPRFAIIPERLQLDRDQRRHRQLFMAAFCEYMKTRNNIHTPIRPSPNNHRCQADCPWWKNKQYKDIWFCMASGNYHVCGDRYVCNRCVESHDCLYCEITGLSYPLEMLHIPTLATVSKNGRDGDDDDTTVDDHHEEKLMERYELDNKEIIALLESNGSDPIDTGKKRTVMVTSDVDSTTIESHPMPDLKALVAIDAITTAEPKRKRRRVCTVVTLRGRGRLRVSPDSLLPSKQLKWTDDMKHNYTAAASSIIRKLRDDHIDEDDIDIEEENIIRDACVYTWRLIIQKDPEVNVSYFIDIHCYVVIHQIQKGGYVRKINDDKGSPQRIIILPKSSYAQTHLKQLIRLPGTNETFNNSSSRLMKWISLYTYNELIATQTKKN